jgi:hypothetical protein
VPVLVKFNLVLYASPYGVKDCEVWSNEKYTTSLCKGHRFAAVAADDVSADKTINTITTEIVILAREIILLLCMNSNILRLFEI